MRNAEGGMRNAEQGKILNRRERREQRSRFGLILYPSLELFVRETKNEQKYLENEVIRVEISSHQKACAGFR